MSARLKRFLIRVGAMASKETLHILRDPRTLYLALGMPVVLLLIFGYGVTFDIDRIPVAVVDQDRSALSRDLLRRIFASGELVDAGPASDVDDAERMLRTGEALAVLTVPRGAGRDLERGESVTVQLALDGADVTVATATLFKAESLARSAAARLGSSAASAAPLEVRMWTRFNPGLRSAVFIVPGLAVFLLAIAAVLLTALTVAGEWERGSLEQLFASPVGRLEFVLGKLLPYLAIGLLQLLLVLAVGASAFDVPLRGNVPALLLVGVLFLVGMLGQGLLISVLARNQLVATQAGALSSLLPSMLLSGFVIPLENMPAILQWLSHVIPARYMVHATREVMLKGASFGELTKDVVALSLFAAVVIAASTARFRRRLA